MSHAAIIADDLTGACDSGIQLHKRGYAVQVLIDAAAYKGLEDRPQYIYAVNTDTRSIPPEEAYEKVYTTATALQKNGITWFYKKVDSVLRGSTGRELEAMLDALGYDVAIIAPAFPTNGRRVIGGRLLVDNGCVSANFSGVEAVEATSQGKCGSIGLACIRGLNGESFVSEVTALRERGIRLILTDCETDEDMKQVARGLEQLPLKALPAGSAGLIAQLHFSGEMPPKDGWWKLGQPRQAPVIMVIGTRHPVTVAQVEKMKERPDTRFILLESEGLSHETLEERLAQALEGQEKAEGPCCIVITTQRIYGEAGEETVIHSDLFNGLITEALAELTKRVLYHYTDCSLILSGGATASAVFGRLGAHRITLLEEPLPGIVAGYTKQGEKHILVATKSGGFGDNAALTQLIDYMYALAQGKGTTPWKAWVK